MNGRVKAKDLLCAETSTEVTFRTGALPCLTPGRLLLVAGSVSQTRMQPVEGGLHGAALPTAATLAALEAMEAGMHPGGGAGAGPGEAGGDGPAEPRRTRRFRGWRGACSPNSSLAPRASAQKTIAVLRVEVSWDCSVKQCCQFLRQKLGDAMNIICFRLEEQSSCAAW